MIFVVSCCYNITTSQNGVLLLKDNTLFVFGGKVVKITHLGVESKALVWRLKRNVAGKWLWNFEHEEKIQFESHQMLAGSYTVINDDLNQDWNCTEDN